MEGPVPLNRPTAPLGRANSVLRARARAHFVKDFPGPLSIKSVTEGTVAWKCGGRDRVVDRDSFLLLHAGEPYSMEIDSRMPVGTLCVFFADGWVESVYTSMVGADPDGAPRQFPLPGGLHLRDDRILPRMQAIARSGGCDALWLDEQFLDLARELVALDAETVRRIARMPARRPSTREELFRRVQRGQDYLHSAADAAAGLEEIARQACLSPYHFHRAFTRAFGQTPHRYRTRLRLERARRMLESGHASVTEICGAVGFESLPSFSALFRQAYGFPPTAARRQLSKIR